MEWPIFALVQMAVITVGVSVALWLRVRGFSAQNRALRDALEASPAEPAPDREAIAREWLSSRIAELDPAHQHTPLVKLVLEQQLAPRDDFYSELERLVGPAAPTLETEADATGEAAPIYADPLEEPEDAFAAPLPASADAETTVDDATRIKLLESQLEEALGEIDALRAGAPANDDADPDELKALLKQFTRDSREMMACIQALEQENAELRTQLGLVESSPESDQDADAA